MFAPFRSSGLALRPAQLPGRFGQGELGPQAGLWLEALAEMGQQVWFFPDRVVDEGSAEGVPSVLAGDPLEVCFEGLLRDGLLQPRDLLVLPVFSDAAAEPPAAVREVRSAVLRLAVDRFLRQCEQSPLVRGAFEAFCDREASWLDDFALFEALQSLQPGRPWTQWPVAMARRDPAEMAMAMVELEPEMEAARVLQFFHDRQWRKLRQQARALGVWLMASLPDSLAAASPEAWAFQDEAGELPSGLGSRWQRACAERRGACFDVLRGPMCEPPGSGVGNVAGVPVIADGQPRVKEVIWQGQDPETWWQTVGAAWHSDTTLILADAAGFWTTAGTDLEGRMPDLDAANPRFYKIVTKLKGLTAETGRGSREFLQL